MRKHIYWKLREEEIALGATPLVIALVSLTPDSGPVDAERAYAQALLAEAQGAALLELTPETLRAGSAITGEEEQLHRVVPALKKLRDYPLPIVVRTSRAAVAARAIEHGGAAIHDPSGLTADVDLGKVVSDTRAGLILGHMRGAPESWARQGSVPHPLQAVVAELRSAVHRATRATVDRKYLMVSPGLGLGKRREENAAILAGLRELANLEAPLVVYTDAPGMLTQQPSDVDACTVAAVLAGAYAVGALDVSRTLALVKSAEAILAAQPAPEPEPTGVTRRRSA